MLENVEMKEPIKKSEVQSHTLSIKDIIAFTSVKKSTNKRRVKPTFNNA